MKIETLKRNASGILTAIGCAGVLTTAYFASDEAEAAKMAVKERKPANTYEHLMAALPKRKKTIASAAVTIACITGAHAIDAKQLAALAGSYAAMGGAFTRYKDTAKRYLGEDKFKELSERFDEEEEEMKSGNEVVHWFYEPISGRFFEATWADYYQAIDDAHRILTLEGELKFNNFIYFLGLNCKALPDSVGWDTADLELRYGYTWFDVTYDVRNDPENGDIDYNFNDGRLTYELVYNIGPGKMGALTEET